MPVERARRPACFRQNVVDRQPVGALAPQHREPRINQRLLFVNDGSVVHQRLESQYWEQHLKRLIESHAEETQSRFARRLLNDWMLERGKFWQIAPKEMLDKLAHPLSDARAAILAE